MLNNDSDVLSKDPIDILSELSLKFEHEPWLSWDAETLLMQLPGVTDSIAMDKVLAVKACAFNSKVNCTLALAFEKTCKAFCNNVCIMDEFQPLFMEEVFYGIKQIQLIVNEIHGVMPEFGGEIPGYVAAVAKVRAFTVLPKPLSFAEEATQELIGYAPNPSEMELVEGLDKLSLEELRNPATLDNLHTEDNQQDALVARLIGCYLYDPK